MTPKELQNLRHSLSIATQALVNALDIIDGDPDLETADFADSECNGDYEPTLGNQGLLINGVIEYDLELEECD